MTIWLTKEQRKYLRRLKIKSASEEVRDALQYAMNHTKESSGHYVLSNW